MESPINAPIVLARNYMTDASQELDDATAYQLADRRAGH